MDTLTNSQRNALKQFKEYIADVLTPEYTDTILIKWLRARNYDVKASENFFREMCYHRILFGLDTIVDTYEKPEVADKYESIAVLGFAKDGSLIRYSGSGRVDFYGFVMAMSSYDLCKYLSYIMECDIQALKEENLKTGKNVEEVLYVINLEGFSIHQILHKNVIETCLDFVRLLQDYYPEIWSHILLVNAPTVFDAAFRILKPVLRGPMLDKMRVVNKDSTRSVLLEYIDEDILPAFLGGKRVDCNGDPQCKEFVKISEKIPENFYILNSSSAVLLTPEDPRTIAFLLGRRSVRNICVPIYQGGTVIKLKMRADNGSVGLAILYKERSEVTIRTEELRNDPNNPEFPGDNEYLDENDENCKFKMISIAMRAQMHCAPMDMQLFLPNTGIYILRLSNSDSWFSTRKVMVQYDLIPPQLESSTQPENMEELTSYN